MSNDDVTVSVCIPSRDRPDMLLECIRSILEQTMQPQEIVIGDDSTDARTETMLRKIDVPNLIKLVYLRNRPPVGQSRNVQRIFEATTSGWLVLIHDDDWLLSTALQHLTSPLRNGLHVDAVFGNQLVARADGRIDRAASSRLNAAFHRTPERCGVQTDAAWSAAIQQFPNNGYLLRRSLAVTVGYHKDGISDGCDFAFGVELALAGARFFYIPIETTVYRLSPASVGRGRTAGNAAAYDFARTVWTYRSALPLGNRALRQHVRKVVHRAAIWCGMRRRHRVEALKWVFHPTIGVHWWGKEGLHVLFAILAPRIRARMKHLLARHSI